MKEKTMIITNYKNSFFIAVMLLLLIACGETQINVIYVDEDALAGGDGTSWEKAYTNLQDALNDAAMGEEIWIAEGTYKPILQIGGEGDRYKSFQMKNGVALYGGFVGIEITRGERDWQNNITVLSGDHNGDDNGQRNNGENSYHVVHGNGTDSTTILDGFFVTGGNANFDVWPDDGGGGMNNHDGSPVIRNCTFKSNAAFADGGGMRNWGENSKPIIINCVFIGNSASQEGGGMMNGPGSKPTVLNTLFKSNKAGEDGGGMYNNESFNSLIANCIFKDNSADLTGGGMYNVNSSNPAVINCTFSNNLAKTAGGGICNNNGYPELTNCILWSNSAPADPEVHNMGESNPVISYSSIAGGFAGDGNIDKDPLFADKDLRLSAESPCVDVGDNKSISESMKTDLDGGKRIVNSTVDIGAYEYQ